ncbi:hypothetical protein BT96DRAFT_1024711 [Gymnopus androsaceus JB14]|uniref:Uncharacterized protein n=1 Tax=Gymnopus androsaceus JB14 TaxID=1447944 RepID=A0A6A4GWK3_9AGAR|nr:hypothetical protein BT96DRAFT_1024711 [Gymnopus androsaceus JB14]
MEPNAHSDCPFLRLPSELITNILSLCPKPSLLILCRVSRFIREFSLPFLYRDLSFVNPSLFINCCRNLVKYDAAAFSVRRLAISFHSDPIFLSAFFRILAMPYHDYLNYAYWSYRSMARKAISTLPFYNRVTFLISSISSSKTPSHSHHRLPISFGGTRNVALFPRIQFQNSCSLLHISLTSFQTITLDEACILDAVGHLQRQAGDTVKEATLFTRGFTGPLPRTIACRFPNITTLCLVHLSLGNPDIDEALYPTETCFDNLKALLPSLQQLTTLCVTRMALFAAALRVPSLEEACRIVTAFGSVSPKLSIVVYDEYQWTKVPLGPHSENVWIPHLFGLAREVEDSEITQWSLDMICAQDNPSYWIQLLIGLPPVILITDKVQVSWSRVERMVEEIRKRMVSRGIQ